MQYKYWQGMLDRCYNEKRKNTPTYIDCTVCDEWLIFSNFCDWYEDNFYLVEGHKMDLDKDLLVKKNKIYSPQTCCFLPHKINGLFNMGQSKRGEYPIGVHKRNVGNTYRSNVNVDGMQIKHDFNTIEKAHENYKKIKEAHIKDVAERFKKYIPLRVYEAMLNWKVEIND